MQIHMLRHATLVIQIGELRILFDPMLSPAGAMPPVANASVQLPIPIVELPIEKYELRYMLDHVDAVLVSHTHRDHWDAQAVELLPKEVPIFCQPSDAAAIEQAEFTQVNPVAQSLTWRNLTIQRTSGRHGTGEIGAAMGEVSGFVLSASNEPKLYLAGDTIWCPEVEQALAEHQPDVVVLHAGAAQFLTGDPITMTADDVVQVCRAAPNARIIAVHMETVNHCLLTRDQLRERLAAEGLLAQVAIPADGELIVLGNRS